LERIHWNRDVHFYTNTTIDTLDYSGESLNSGSKVVFAAYGNQTRVLLNEMPTRFNELQQFINPRIILPGIIAIQTQPFSTYANAKNEMDVLQHQLTGISSTWEIQDGLAKEIALIVVCDDATFTSDKLNNFLWVTFTRCNPSHDIYGIDSVTKYKHWGCEGPLVIDARIKPHHAPPVEKDPEMEQRIDKYFEKGGPLYGVLK
jgi:4-hydroxy-3-polyprenylbenzoate decarboxylase